MPLHFLRRLLLPLHRRRRRRRSLSCSSSSDCFSLVHTPYQCALRVNIYKQPKHVTRRETKTTTRMNVRKMTRRRSTQYFREAIAGD